MTSGHVIDRFVEALRGHEGQVGVLAASPEAARMLIEHANRFPTLRFDGSTIFGYRIVVDEKLPRGYVLFR